MHAFRSACLAGLLALVGSVANAQVTSGVVPVIVGIGWGSSASGITIGTVTPVILPETTPVPPPITPPSLLTPGAGMPALTRVVQVVDPAWSASSNVIDVSTPRTGAFPARLSNVSVRGYVGPDSTLIGGGAITGSSALPTFARAVGPTLKSFGITTPLQWPMLTVYENSILLGRTSWIQPALADDATYVGSFPSTLGDPQSYQPTDAALVGRPAPGNLTAQCTAADDGAGIALIEFYDASSNTSATSPRFHNFSGRARVTSGEGTLTVGFVVAGSGNITLLLRGVGTTLAQFGVTDPTLPDPIIELYHGSTVIAMSDNWRAESRGSTILSDTATAVGAFALSDPNEAALLITLPAGAYTLQLRDTLNRSGVGLAEIYEVPQTP